MKILDFGLAKLQLSHDGVPSDSRRTMTGVILGTAGYMAPEQVKGESVDSRADLFALGVMLYEMLTGAASVPRDEYLRNASRRPDHQSTGVSSLNPRVPPALGRIVMRLLEKSSRGTFSVGAGRRLGFGAGGYVCGRSASPECHRTVETLVAFTRVIWWSALASAAALVLVLGTAWSLQRVSSSAGQSLGLTRFTWPLPPGIGLVSRRSSRRMAG